MPNFSLLRATEGLSGTICSLFSGCSLSGCSWAPLGAVAAGLCPHHVATIAGGCFCYVLALLWDLHREMQSNCICSYFSQSPELVPLLWFTLYPILSPSLSLRRLSPGQSLHLLDALSQCSNKCPRSTAPVNTASMQAPTTVLIIPVTLALHHWPGWSLCSSVSCPSKPCTGSGSSAGP